MKKIIPLLFAFALLGKQSTAQTTAMDFNQADCNSNMQNLFADLDAGNAVILEFFMTSCPSCVTAGDKLEILKSSLLAEFPGQVKSYAIGYTNSYSCVTVANWVTTNGFTSIPMDQGAAQVAYYGGFGMPTIVVLGGVTTHDVLGTPYIGFSTSDTTTMGTDIRNYLNGEVAGISNLAPQNFSVNFYPNPSTGILNFNLELSELTNVKIELFDLTGRNVTTFLNENLSVGTTIKTFDTSLLENGNYIIQVTANGILSNYKLNILN